MQEIYKIFDKKIGSSRISSCLALCGYTEFEHFKSFNTESLTNMEKYIGKVCFFMKKEERKKYIDEIFMDNPKEFIFSPRCTDEILKIVASIKEHLDKTSELCGEVIDITSLSEAEENENIKSSSLNRLHRNTDYKLFPKIEKYEIPHDFTLQAQLLKTPSASTDHSHNKISLKNCYPNSENENIPNNENENIPDDENERLKSFYESIQQKSSLHFINCHLEPYIDFEVLFYDADDVLYNSKAYFICKLCSGVNASKLGLTVRFDLSYKRNMIFKNIKIHLLKHFKLKIDEKALKINVNKRLKGKRKYKKRCNHILS